MGGCCGSSGQDKVTPDDVNNFPVKERGCTDWYCLPVFVAAQVAFVVVSIMGISTGNASKLYLPRDYQGAYCGAATNWNDGPNTAGMPKLSFTMNVSTAAAMPMKQALCGSVAKGLLVDGTSTVAPLLTNTTEQNEYLCACCLAPCASCDSAIEQQDPPSLDQLGSVITARMQELTDPSKAGDLFSPGGANGQAFSTTALWDEATKYFNLVCLPSCASPSGMGNGTSESRTFTYKPAPDGPYAKYWAKLLEGGNTAADGFATVLRSSFNFTALPKSVCPYDDAGVCVPFPGVDTQDLAVDSSYCTFGMAGEVVAAVGAAAAEVFEGVGGSAFKNATEASFGKWAGDFAQSLDTFIVVCVLSFVIGLVFLVLLRLLVGVCVWIAVLLSVLAFVVGGYLVFILSGQCEGASIFETGTQTAVAITVAASTAVADAVSGDDVPSEACEGKCHDYRGRQTYTKFGIRCAVWEDQDLYPQYRAANYTQLSPANTTNNYCRNPYKDGDSLVGNTIWCVTTDPEVKWQECIRIGVIQPVCSRGYQISSQQGRDALFYVSFIIWGLGAIWTILIFCLIRRIQLAIAINKVAAVYLATNPSTLLVPIVQALVAILWCTVWFFCAAFLLSQVPTDYTPTGAFATYAEAFGTSPGCAFWETGPECTGTPGACTNKWPTGSVWRDNLCEDMDTDSPKCWRCAPPRYVFDLRFAVSFFVFLWNNAFNIAMGQMIIAMAVAKWFFSTDKATTSVVGQGVKTACRYHVGTVAVGSFIVAVVQFIRYLMKYFEKQAEAQKNRVMVLVLKVLQCCIWCFEKCVRFLNKNAYIQTALKGTSFCTSAKAAFFLILRNAVRFGVMTALGGIISWIGFFCIMAGTGVVGYFLLKAMHPELTPLMPMICFTFVAYFVGKLYMNVFHLAVDTSLQCFLACEEAGTGGEFIPSELSDFVNNNKKKLEDPHAKDPDQGSE